MSHRKRAACVLMLSIMFALAATLHAQPAAEPKERPPIEIVESPAGDRIVKGELLLSLHPQVKESDLKPIFDRLEAKYHVVSRIESLNQFTLAVDHERLAELRQRLANHPYVAAASFNQFMQAYQSPKKAPFDDPVFKKPDNMMEDRDNWNLYRIKAPEAWEISRGGAVIAVLDSGARLEHEELKGRTIQPWTYARDGTCREGMKKILTPNGTTYDYEVRNHGTHVAVTAGGAANNGVGTAGVAPSSPLMPIQVLYFRPKGNADGSGDISGSTEEIVAGLERAVSSGASVVNMSLGTYLDPKVVDQWRKASTAEAKSAIEQRLMPAIRKEAEAYGPVLDLAERRGVIVVAAAGNQSLPAHLYALPLSKRVISVAAITREDKRWDEVATTGFGSNFGPYTTVSAPGAMIYSGLAEPAKAYDYLTGTSMAAPHVAGVVALMKTIDPELRLADVADILTKTGRRLQTDEPIGPLVDARAALEETRRRRDARVPRQPTPPPIIPPVIENPTVPTLSRQGVEILLEPDPWANVEIQRIIEVWLSIAIPRAPADGGAGGIWVYDRFGQIINVRTSIVEQRPAWFSFRFRWFWENALTLDSTNVGSLYEFIVGTLRQGRFDPAPPRVPIEFRPRKEDPRPRQDRLVFNPNLGGTRWTGRNAKGETIEFDFDVQFVSVKRQAQTVKYSYRINTTFTPMAIEFYPDAIGAAPLRAAVETVRLGEMLIRFDATSGTAAAIAPASRGDPLTFVVKRIDVEIPELRTDAAGTTMRVSNRQHEALIATYFPEKNLPKGSQPPLWTLPEGFGLHSYALRHDGLRAWMLLVNAASDFKGNRWQLWSIDSNGSNAKQSDFEFDPKDFRNPVVRTSGDGKVAWFVLQRPIPFQDPFHLQVRKATIGGPATVVLETKDRKGITNGWDPQATSDGRSLLFIASEGIVRVDDAGAHFLVETKHIVHEGRHLGGADRLTSLVTNADGTRWAAITQMHFADKKYDPVNAKWVVLAGSGTDYKAHAEKIQLGHFSNLSMSEDGRAVLFEKQYRTFLWREGHISEVAPQAFAVYSATLAGNGRSLYAVANPAGAANNGLAAFVHDLNSGRRRLAVSGLMGAGQWNTGGAVQVNRDGSVVASVSSGLFEGGPRGLFISREGEAPADYPTIRSVKQRYEGSKLTLSVEAQGTGPIQVYAATLKDGWINIGYVTDAAKNPLAALAGLPQGHFLASNPKQPGVFETTIDLGDRHAWLDDTYVVRVMVVNASRNRLTAHDVGVLR
ncbi:MAG: S8 family serine peptidase [Gemmataceae bacterium]